MPAPPRFGVGELVKVQSRTWPGINRPGGVGRVLRSAGGSMDVKYLLGGSDKDVPLAFVSCVEIAHSEKRRRPAARVIVDSQEAPSPMRAPKKRRRAKPAATSSSSSSSSSSSNGSSSNGRLPPPPPSRTTVAAKGSGSAASQSAVRAGVGRGASAPPSGGADAGGITTVRSMATAKLRERERAVGLAHRPSCALGGRRKQCSPGLRHASAQGGGALLSPASSSLNALATAAAVIGGVSPAVQQIGTAAAQRQSAPQQGGAGAPARRPVALSLVAPAEATAAAGPSPDSSRISPGWAQGPNGVLFMHDIV